MANKRVFGIAFIPESINSNIIMLKPSYIVDGNLYSDKLINRYEELYKPISFARNFEDYDRMYGLCVTEDELMSYAEENDFPSSVKEYLEGCAKLYLNYTKKYIFLLEKGNNKYSCYAIGLLDKKVKKININESGIKQLLEEKP